MLGLMLLFRSLDGGAVVFGVAFKERMMFFKKLLMVLLLAALTVPAMGYAQDNGGGESILYVGVITDFPDEFVGVAVDGEEVTIYICDGNAAEGTVSIAQWFTGEIADNAISIAASNGNQVEVTIEDGRAIGKITLADGSERDFSVTLAQGKSALFRSEFTLGEDAYVGGWLVLEDGSVRGAVFKAGTQELVAASFSGGNQLNQIDPIDLPAR
jgi:hypothetical protein